MYTAVLIDEKPGNRINLHQQLASHFPGLRIIRESDNPADGKRMLAVFGDADPSGSRQRIALPSSTGFQYVPVQEIIYLEARSNYTVLYLAGGKKMTMAKTLKDFQALLPVTDFIRIHHSYLINKSCMMRYIKGEGGQVVMTNGVVLEVARRRKDLFLRALGI